MIRLTRGQIMPSSRVLPQSDILQILPLGRFVKQLSEGHQDRFQAEMVVKEFGAHAHVCRKGMSADWWFGIIAGVVKIQVSSPDGRGTTLATFSEGCWFGEGALLKEECWPYDAVTVNNVVMAMIPSSCFRWLLNNSLPFNHFLIDQLNMRLGQFIGRCEHARLHQADQHVAHCIAELLDPRLNPISDRSYLRMSQEELGHLAGVSRAIVNRVLQDLERDGIIRVSYGSISLIDLQGLRRFSESRR